MPITDINEARDFLNEKIVDSSVLAFADANINQFLNAVLDFIQEINETPFVFNTSLTFASSTSDSEGSVAGVVPSTNATTKFEFNSIAVILGSTMEMTITVSGSPRIVVTFPSDYLGKRYRFTNTTGTVYEGKFINGTAIA